MSCAKILSIYSHRRDRCFSLKGSGFAIADKHIAESIIYLPIQIYAEKKGDKLAKRKSSV